jgi:hypothetical protein
LDGSNPDSGGGDLTDIASFKDPGKMIDAQGIVGSGIAWQNAAYIIFTFNPIDHDIGITLFDVTATDKDGVAHPLHHSEPDLVFHQGAPTDNLQWAVSLNRPPSNPPDPTPLERLTPEERSSRARLIAHLNNNKPYYYRQIWMGEDPNHRLIRMGDLKVEAGGESCRCSTPLRIGLLTWSATSSCSR